MRVHDLPGDLDERLWEWAYFFRDRRKLEACGSAEKHYKAHSDDFAIEGWGDVEAPPRTQPAKSYRLLRALETHEQIQSLDKQYKWALTYSYCYPSLPKFIVLRLMKKYIGRHLNWKQYLDILDVGRMRVWTTTFSEKVL